MLGGEAELLLQLFQRRRRAERFHAETNAPRAHIPAPAKRARLLHGDAGGDSRRQHLIAILLRLLLEDLPRWHADHTRTHPITLQLLLRIEAERHLAARCQQQDLRLTLTRIR